MKNHNPNRESAEERRRRINLPISSFRNFALPRFSADPAGQRLVEIPASAPKLAGVDSDKTAKLSFEAALTKLETIVDSMESGEVPLAELLAKYEEGSKLLKVCEGRLKEAELKIEALKKTKGGTAAFEPFESNRSE